MTARAGRTTVERLLAAGELERVTVSVEKSRRLLADAERHLVFDWLNRSTELVERPGEDGDGAAGCWYPWTN